MACAVSWGRWQRRRAACWRRLLRERCCRRAGHGDGVGHDFDKKRRERVVSRILLLMARPGQTTGPLFRPVGEAVEMECMRAFREEWGSCVENGFEGLDKGEKQALKEALKGEWLDNVDRLYRRKVPSLLSADDLNAIRNHFGLDSRSFKGVEGSARNDGVGGNGDGGVGNGDAAEASAESSVDSAETSRDSISATKIQPGNICPHVPINSPS